jgi:hypothetical protein
MTTIPSSRKRRSTLDVLSGNASYNNTRNDRSIADGTAFAPLPEGTSPWRQQNRPSMYGPQQQQQQQQQLKGHHHTRRRRRQKSCFFRAFVTTSILLFVSLSVLLQKATLSSSPHSSSSSSALYIRNARELIVEALVIAEPSAAAVLVSVPAAIRRPKVHKPMSVVFHVPKTKIKTTTIIIPAGIAMQNGKLERRDKRAVSGIAADYAGLNISSLPPSHLDLKHREQEQEQEQDQSPLLREIPINAHDLYETERQATLAALDAQQPKLRPKYRNDEDITGQVLCRRNNWRSKIFPVCNHFHEATLDRSFESSNSGGSSNSGSKGMQQQRQQLQEYMIEFRGHGYFRDSWLFQRPEMYGSGGGASTSASKTARGWSGNSNRNSSSSFVWKSMRLKEYFHYDYDMMYQIHQEAIILERLTSSERIVDMYGHCGTSIFAEYMKEDVTPDIVPGHGYMPQKDLDKLETTDVHPMNNLTLVEKLDMALVMAESLADIHGYKGGVIAHGDVHPDQWLRSSTGQIKLKYVESQSSSLSCTVWCIRTPTAFCQFLQLTIFIVSNLLQRF